MIRKFMIVAVVSVAVILSSASLGILFGGDNNSGAFGSGPSSNGDLSGCYTEPDSGTLNSYWFDGIQNCSHNMWTQISGSVAYACTYQVAPGQLELTYDDGSTESFSLSGDSNAIELNGNYFEYSGGQCS